MFGFEMFESQLFMFTFEMLERQQQKLEGVAIMTDLLSKKHHIVKAWTYKLAAVTIRCPLTSPHVSAMGASSSSVSFRTGMLQTDKIYSRFLSKKKLIV